MSAATSILGRFISSWGYLRQFTSYNTPECATSHALPPSVQATRLRIYRSQTFKVWERHKRGGWRQSDNHVLRLLASSPDSHSFPHLGTSERLRPGGRDHRTARSQSEDNHVGVGGYGLRQKDWLESVKLLREVK